MGGERRVEEEEERWGRGGRVVGRKGGWRRRMGGREWKEVEEGRQGGGSGVLQ